jgi:hypothetical protein
MKLTPVLKEIIDRRNQKVGPGRQETKLTWVRPYIKGPDDKPLVVPPKKVFVVSR